MYEAKIVDSSRDFTARERLKLKDTSDAVKLADAEEGYMITPESWAKLEVHCDEAENTDFEIFCIMDTDGQVHYTSSDSFERAFRDIWNEMQADGSEEEWSVKLLRKKSKNFSSDFLVCSIV